MNTVSLREYWKQPGREAFEARGGRGDGRRGDAGAEAGADAGLLPHEDHERVQLLRLHVRRA